ncbi:hypothetical protein Bhyg_15316 [Pseudolycoriella hygida]|uniref:Uncharacterized protein n=1 Tax=Pseudolycoriella hygida TaxID=35572 RepID=A0A9Q0MRL4_9DIPT|nr:hypothetical protein Bhyg_15316 [Pseudolycoriella hygida]
MTNSNNRTLGGGGNSEGNASRQRLLSSSTERSTERQPFGKRRKNKGKKVQNNPASPTNSVSSSQSDSNNYLSGRSNQQSFINFSSRSHQQYNYSNGINIQVHRSSPGGFSAASSTPSSSPPNASLFAGSKCFDAPPPNALPRPPSHWLSCGGVLSALSSDDDYLSYNLKMALNVGTLVDNDLLLNTPICINNSPATVTL